MDQHPAPASSEGPAPADAETPAPIRGIAVASVSLGFFSLLVFWWFPFGFMLSCVGLVLSTYGLVAGIRGGKDGEHLSLVGFLLSGISFGLILTLFKGFHRVLGDM